VTTFKDFIFDFPKSHKIKNIMLSFNLFGNKIEYKPNKNRTYRNYYIIKKSPLVIITSEHVRDLQLFSKLIGEKKDVVFLVYFWWTLFDAPKTITQIIFHYRTHQKLFPRHQIIFLLNSIEEYHLLTKNGISCEFIHQNSLIDSNVFKPLFLKKEYDVIYNARIEKMKRHYLLKDCRKISLISAFIHGTNRQKKKYIEKLKTVIPNSKIVNFTEPIKFINFDINSGPPQLTNQLVCEEINKAKVGVILSAKEGACYASIEYLLAGIPVVSTKNIGGRNYFLDKRFCRIVSSNPKAIKNAVDELIGLNISPNYIREETIKKITPHVQMFKNLLRDILKMNKQKNSDFNSFWDSIYTNKMIKYAQLFPKSFVSDLN
jgi:glycosyltransferase involved in cell wall biosynthesis